MVRLSDADGIEGWGEAYPSWLLRRDRRDGAGGVLGRGASACRRTVRSRGCRARDSRRSSPQRARAARAALSAALHDLVGKRLGQPLWRLWGLDPRQRAHVVVHDRHRHAGEDAGQGRARPPQYPILKIKLGTDHDEALLRDDPGARPTSRSGSTPTRDGPASAPSRCCRYSRSTVSSFWSSRCAPDDLEGHRGRAPGVAGHPGRRGRELPRGDRYPASGRGGGRDQHQARQVRQPARSAAHDRHGARARPAGDGRVHDRDVARRSPRPRISRRSSTSPTWMAPR